MTGKTLVKVPPAPRKSRLSAALPKVAAVTPNNTSQPSDSGYESFVDMNFKVTPAFRKRVKLESHLRGLTNKELLESMFNLYLETNGGTMERPAEELIQG